MSSLKIGRVIQKFSSRFFCSLKADCLSVPEKKGLVLGVYEGIKGDPVLTPAACKFNEKMKGKLLELIIGAGDVSKKGQARAFNNIDDEYWSVAVVGLGKEKQGFNQLEAIDDDRESVRTAAARGAQLLHQQRVGHVFVEGLGRPEQAAEGSALAIWRYQDNKSKATRAPVPTLELYDDPDYDGWQRGLFKAEAQNFARLLSDIPGNQLTPTSFAQTAVTQLCPCGIKVEIHDRDWIESKKMQALLSFAKGSCEPPCFLEMSYCGGPPEQKPIVLVGKGSTYDAGGLCLKSGPGLVRYRADMAGAACVIAVVKAASMLSLPLNLTGLIPLLENLASGMSAKPGDVIKALNNKSVEIENTDHEGRVITADTLVWAQQNLDPKLVINIASLKSDARKTFGSACTPCFTNSEVMWRQIRKASIISGDRLWRLPLWKFYKRKITQYTHVDVSNVGHGAGYPCLAAAFLSQFVKCVDWVHLDTEGTGKRAENRIYPYYTEGRMTGRPVRTIIQLLYQLTCPNPCDRPT